MFGRHVKDEYGNLLIKNPIEEVIRLDSGAMDSITSKLVLREHYETYYQIYNHDEFYVPPLSLVTMHPKERYLPYSRRRRLMENYTLYGIHELYGLNIREFLEQPRCDVELLLELAMEHKRRKDVRNMREDKLSKAMLRNATGES